MRDCSQAGWSLAALVLLAACAGAVSGQQVGGRITDAATGRPVWGALVSAMGAQDSILSTAVTDSLGQYRLDTRRRVSVRLRVERLGYERLDVRPMRVQPTDTLHLDLELSPAPIRVPALLARAKQAQGNLAGFLRRRQTRMFGAFMGPEELAAIQARSGDQLLSLFVGIERDLSGPGVLGYGGYTISPGLFGPTSAANPPSRARYCHPWIYIDGQPMEFWRVGYGRSVSEEPTSTDFYIPVQAIRGVEVYRYWYDAPAQYARGTDRNCAIILLWTDHGFGFRAQPDPANR